MALKGVDEVGVWVRDAGDVASEHDEPGEGDKYERQDLNDTNGVREVVRPASAEYNALFFS